MNNELKYFCVKQLVDAYYSFEMFPFVHTNKPVKNRRVLKTGIDTRLTIGTPQSNPVLYYYLKFKACNK